jgi:protein LTV1
MVFNELAPTQARKARNRADLESELFSDKDKDEIRAPRDNEGEAAEYGIYYDDTEYDYMQHMREIGGDGGGQSIWLEAPGDGQGRGKGKGKEKVSLDESLKAMCISSDGEASLKGEESAPKLVDASILPSTALRNVTYQDQQDVPDSIAGFQPDMDPRLREVLEALEDEEYVEFGDNDDSFFASIAKSGEELSYDQFEELEPANELEDDEGWESDDTAKPPNRSEHSPRLPTNESFQHDLHDSADAEARPEPAPQEEPPDHGDGAFMASFRDLPKSSRAAATPRQGRNGLVGGPASSILTGDSAFTAGGTRRKKRKGALTNSDAYSMTSSSLYRTEGLTLLDARFDKTLEAYAEDAEEDNFADNDTSSIVSGHISNVSGMSNLSGLSGISRASTQPPNLVVRKDFEDIMDEFLGSYTTKGKRRVKKGAPQSGIEQLDEIRRELGRPVGKSAAGALGVVNKD